MSRIVNVIYRGARVAVELVKIDDDGHELEASAAQAWKLMKLAADIDGVIINARTAFRSYDFQKRLHDAYVLYRSQLEKRELWEKDGKKGDPPVLQFAALANKPGTSTHEIGNAVDIDGAAQVGGKIDLWLRANSERFGWKRTVPSENWHYNWFVK